MRVKGIYDLLGLESCAPIDDDYPYKLRAVIKKDATYYEANIEDKQFDEVQKMLKDVDKKSISALKRLHKKIDLKKKYNLLE